MELLTEIDLLIHVYFMAQLLLTGDHFPSRSGGRSFEKNGDVSSTGNDESTGGEIRVAKSSYISRGAAL
jgi:hypothetical protein